MGFCADSDHPMFIYEYLQIESLYGWLHTGKKELLDWRTRLHILQQIAQGMEYLHSCSPSIIHGQLTSTSVYLGDGDAYVVKVADFGIHELSQNADRSPGYLDPEYAVTRRLTEKSDVYSFGVLILEIVSGRIPLGSSTEKDSFNIVEWVRGLHDEGNDEHIPDTCLHGVCNVTMVSRIINLALQATEEDANERPTMSKILNELREVNKTETGHHVVFAEPDNPYNSTDSDAPSSSSAMLSEWCEKDLCINT
ncbi:hypothetical protein KP509_07G100100 [Ceratopteris richardii]|nr:hypothetical protein KP509_07G100100 [Ceratopteris richardii]